MTKEPIQGFPKNKRDITIQEMVKEIVDEERGVESSPNKERKSRKQRIEEAKL
jgi:hypothetical protein